MADEPIDSPERLEGMHAEEAGRRLEEARLRRVLAEAAEAELRVMEAQHRLQRLAARWPSPAVLAKWIVAGVVAGGLLVAWGIGYLRPILSLDTELATKNAAIAAAETRRLEEENKTLETARAELQQQREALEGEKEEINQQLIRAQTQILSDAADAVQRLEAQADLAEERGEEAAALREQVSLLRRAEATAMVRANELERQRIGATAVDAATAKVGDLNEFVFVEGGRFVMGSPPGVGDADEHPQREVTLSPFHIQMHEVSNREYAQFDPTHSFDPREAPFPVTEVTWFEAMAYAEWVGGSLPTEAQWEFAARGQEGREYPWGAGSAIPGVHGNFGPAVATEPGGRFPDGATPEGVHDLAGNVLEWCSDWYGEYPSNAQTNPRGDQSGTLRVLRGGAFFDRDVRAAFRYFLNPYDRLNYVGFRVVVTPFSG